jgi:hypothetical protein
VEPNSDCQTIMLTCKQEIHNTWSMSPTYLKVSIVAVLLSQRKRKSSQPQDAGFVYLYFVIGRFENFYSANLGHRIRPKVESEYGSFRPLPWYYHHNTERVCEVRNMMGSLVSTFPIFLKDSWLLALGRTIYNVQVCKKNRNLSYNIAHVTIQTEV